MLFLSSIFKAAKTGDVQAIQKFIAKGQSPEALDDEGYSPLMLAAEAGHLEAVELLLAKGATVDRRGRRGETALFYAAREGRRRIVELLLARGAEPDACARKKGITPMVIAATRGHEEIVAMLLHAGADLEAVEKHGRTALLLAIEKGHLALVDRLIALGANVEHRGPGGTTPLMQAVKTKDPEIVQRILDRGVDIDARDDQGRTAVQLAAIGGGYSSAEMLIAAGANASQRTQREGWSLSTLAHNGNFDRLANRLAELELAHCQLPVPSNLVEAVLTGDICLVRIFLRNHPNALHEAPRPDGWTPLLIAINRGSFNIAEYLIQRGADVNHANSHGETPLYQAIIRGHVPIVRRLLDAGADPHTACHGLSPLDLVRKQGANPDLAPLLHRFLATQASQRVPPSSAGACDEACG